MKSVRPRFVRASSVASIALVANAAASVGCVSDVEAVPTSITAPQIRAAMPVPDTATSIHVDDVQGKPRELPLGIQLQEERPGVTWRYVRLYDLLHECNDPKCALTDDAGRYTWWEQRPVHRVDRETIFTVALVGGFVGAAGGLGYCTAECHGAPQVLSVVGLGVMAAAVIGLALVTRPNPRPPPLSLSLSP